MPRKDGLDTTSHTSNDATRDTSLDPVTGVRDVKGLANVPEVRKEPSTTFDERTGSVPENSQPWGQYNKERSDKIAEDAAENRKHLDQRHQSRNRTSEAPAGARNANRTPEVKTSQSDAEKKAAADKRKADAKAKSDKAAADKSSNSNKPQQK